MKHFCKTHLVNCKCHETILGRITMYMVDKDIVISLHRTENPFRFESEEVTAAEA